MDLSCEDIQGDETCTGELKKHSEESQPEIYLDDQADPKDAGLVVSELIPDVEDFQLKLHKAKTLLSNADGRQHEVLKELLYLLEALLSCILEMKSDVLEMAEDIKTMLMRSDANRDPIDSHTPQSPAAVGSTADDANEGFSGSLIPRDDERKQAYILQQNAIIASPTAETDTFESNYLFNGEQDLESEASMTHREPSEVTREQQEESSAICNKDSNDLDSKFLKSHSVQNGFSCKRCPMAFVCQKDLEKHMLTHKVKVFRCDLCNRIRKNEQQIVNHVEAHIDPKVEDNTCDVCGKTFKHSKKLLTCNHNLNRKRQRTAAPETRNTCKVCGKSFSKIRNLQAHEKRHERAPVFCQICGKTFLKLRNLKSHVQKHKFGLDGKPFRCTTCDRGFPTELLMHKHVRVHEEDGFKCDKCSKGFSSQRKLYRHKQWHIRQEAVSHLKCHVCSKHFKSKKNLEQHMNRHTGKKPFSCEICGKDFYTYNAKVVHVNKIHRNKTYSRTKFQCVICNETFSATYARDTHYLKHSEEERASHAVVVEKVKCDICGWALRKENLKAHKAKHLTNKTFLCKVCGEILPDVVSVRKQHRLLHPGPFKCDACPRVFKRYKDFSLHKRTHTGDEPFKCGLCGKGFICRTYLQKHESIAHTGVKNFFCEVCGKGFNSMWSLSNHSRIHTGEKPYQCNLCWESFRTNYMLKTHQRVHISIEAKANNTPTQ